jgi:hypothetical protein
MLEKQKQETLFLTVQTLKDMYDSNEKDLIYTFVHCTLTANLCKSWVKSYIFHDTL